MVYWAASAETIGNAMGQLLNGEAETCHELNVMPLIGIRWIRGIDRCNSAIYSTRLDILHTDIVAKIKND